MTEELSLVERAQAGDPIALAEIVETHQGTIYNVALRMCGNAYEAEETLQETFLKVILPRFQGRAQLSTWLYGIASNACLTRRRSEATRPNLVSMDATAGDADATDDYGPKYFIDWSHKPEDEVLDAELRSTMETAVTQLPPNLRLVFIWRDLEGLSTRETAKIWGFQRGKKQTIT